MKSLRDLKYGFADAENYKRRENRDTFNRIFLRTEELDALNSPNIFFLVGDKGTGKTAYAVYLSNANDSKRSFLHKFIRETDYLKFVGMKQQNALTLSNYVDIWKVIFLNLIAASIIENEPKPLFSRSDRFTQLEQVIRSYDDTAFDPEVISGLHIVENASDLMKAFIKLRGLEVGGEEVESIAVTSEKKKFQLSLLQLERQFEDAIRSLKLKKDHVVFIDGIDLRPESVPFDEYLSCVKGLANALWTLNNDFFPSIRDSSGRCRVIALLRPDIFNSMGMQNRNTKLKDNSVVLDWRTRYDQYRSSKLFRVADRFFNVQQEEQLPQGGAWNYYFPFDATEVKEEHVSPSSFITVLRYTFHRPRDIFAIIDTLNKLFVIEGRAESYFTAEQVTSREFRRAYGAYMLGEVKDSLSFYYDDDQYQIFLKFFEFLDGHAKFDYTKFLSAYADFMKFVGERGTAVPEFMKTPEEFLQFLYELNVICYIEETADERFIRWCFIERSPSNISPKVKTEARYEIHYSLGNALNTGKVIRSRRGSATAVVKPSKSGFFEGRVKFFNPAEHFGFIIQDGMPVDVFVHQQRILQGAALKAGDRVRFRLEKDNRDRLMAVDVMKVG